MELSLTGEQQVPLCNSGLELPVGFLQQDYECSEQQNSSYGCLRQRRKATPCLQLIQNSFAVPPQQETASLGLPLKVPPRRWLAMLQEPQSQGWVCQETPPETARAVV